MVIIVDFGSQTCHLIGKRLRYMGIKYKIIDPCDISAFLDKNTVAGIILSGGPDSVYADGSVQIDKKVFSLGVPIFGICYGWQIIADYLGGEVVSGQKEYGPANINIVEEGVITKNITDNSKVWMSHGDSVVKLPSGFEVVGSTDDLEYAFVANYDTQIFGTQFHPEVDHTECGNDIILNFVRDVCGLQVSEYKIDTGEIISNIKDHVSDDHVICAVSGGVDSSVVAALVGKAIGKQLHLVYVESGLMRKGTAERVRQTFGELLGFDATIVDARDEFLAKLEGVNDPEQKRKIIGNLYIDIFDRESAKLVVSDKINVKYLAQGTIYSDVIESKGTKHSSKIKSHHNVGGLPDDMKLELLEPLRQFYKDEVRQIGRSIGLGKDVVDQQVFPGPGHAIRIMGSLTADRLKMQEQADDIVVEVMQAAGLYDDAYMCYSIMTGSFSTAVKGDARQYLEVCAVRIIESSNVMTARWSQVPYDVLDKIATKIVNQVPGISRVVYDITNKPPSTMEWE